jgi:hypothetical protein
MPPLFILSGLVTLALIVHCIKTDRNRIWIYVLVLLPGLGSLAYVGAELLPEMLG